MAIPITVPRLGWNMDEGVFAGWLKTDGDTVRPGEALFSLESEKATEDVECLDEGILRIPPNAPQAGERVAVGVVIGYLVAAGEAPPFESTAEAAPAVVPQVSVAEKTEAVPRLRESEKHRARPRSSPRARRVARELGVDWARLTGSGKSGRIRERDVRAAASTPSQPAVPLTPARRAIAEHMAASHATTAPVTLTTTVEATNLVNLRNQFKAAATDAVIPSYTDFLVKLTAAALQKHPLLNAQWVDGQIRPMPDVHVGIAVDTEAGLLVPVIRDVPSLSLRQLAAKSRELIERAVKRRLAAEEMQGGTFTVSNLGSLGVDAFTPLLHLPQCATLGIGRIVRRPVVIGEQIVAREQMTLSLTFDHRIVDGAPAARFLQTLSQAVENPGPWLMP